ncbi:MAG: hypothetical protein QOG65_2908, partial [Actinomycetota bacterium]|nr:hypothetical protein [Actinomycetota bacterium]
QFGAFPSGPGSRADFGPVQVLIIAVDAIWK